MSYKEQIERVQQILEEARVPKFWYSIGEPQECRISIIDEDDGIHVFIPERGDKTGERIYTHWYNVIIDVANSFELKYTEKVFKIALEYL